MVHRPLCAQEIPGSEQQDIDRYTNLTMHKESRLEAKGYWYTNLSVNSASVYKLQGTQVGSKKVQVH